MDEKDYPESFGPFPVKLTRAALDVLIERQRQIVEEGYDAAHDNEHVEWQLVAAAGCYAMQVAWPEKDWVNFWPISWELSSWKPSDNPRRNLVKAAALLLAELERLDRKEWREGK